MVLLDKQLQRVDEPCIVMPKTWISKSSAFRHALVEAVAKFGDQDVRHFDACAPGTESCRNLLVDGLGGVCAPLAIEQRVSVAIVREVAISREPLAVEAKVRRIRRVAQQDLLEHVVRFFPSGLVEQGRLADRVGHGPVELEDRPHARVELARRQHNALDTLTKP